MSQVDLRIGGRNYSVSCAAGEEAHVARLGGLIDAKLQQMGGNPSPQEAQNLLFASLLLADELHEARETLAGVRSERDAAQAETELAHRDLADAQRKLAPLEEERDALAARLREVQARPAPGNALDDPGLAPALEHFADLLENCADKLEGVATSP